MCDDIHHTKKEDVVSKRTSNQKEAYWKKHIDQYRNNGAPLKSLYCKENKLNYSQFLYWDGKLNKESEPKRETNWVELNLPRQTPDYHCELVLKSGSVVKFYTVEALKRLEHILSVLAC
jgi:hypothetical protein